MNSVAARSRITDTVLELAYESGLKERSFLRIQIHQNRVIIFLENNIINEKSLNIYC